MNSFDINQSKYWPHSGVAATTGITPDPIQQSIAIVGAKTVETNVSTVNWQGGLSFILPYTTADAAGTFTIWACNDWDDSRKTTRLGFVDVTSLFTAKITGGTVAGASGTCIFATNAFEFQAVKVRYTQSSGTLTLKSSFNSKAN